MDEDTLRTIYDQMKMVLQKAIDHNANPEDLPDGFLVPHCHEGGSCPDCGGGVERVKIAGRTAYYYPECQRQS